MTLLKDLERIERDAVEFGLQWETKEQIMTQIRNECSEIEEHFNSQEQQEQLQDEIGDLLHAAFSLCVFCNFDPELTLRNSLNKFKHRLDAMKSIVKEQGLSHVRGKSFEELMWFWEQAKIKTKG